MTVVENNLPKFKAFANGTGFEGQGDTPDEARKDFDKKLSSAVSYNSGGDKTLEAVRKIASKVITQKV